MTLPTEVHATHPMRRAQHETISRLEQDGSLQGWVIVEDGPADSIQITDTTGTHYYIAPDGTEHHVRS